MNPWWGYRWWDPWPYYAAWPRLGRYGYPYESPWYPGGFAYPFYPYGWFDPYGVLPS